MGQFSFQGFREHSSNYFCDRTLKHLYTGLTSFITTNWKVTDIFKGTNKKGMLILYLFISNVSDMYNLVAVS